MRREPWERVSLSDDELIARVRATSRAAFELASGVALHCVGPDMSEPAIDQLRAQLAELTDGARRVRDECSRRELLFLISEATLDVDYARAPSPLTSLRIARIVALR